VDLELCHTVVICAAFELSLKEGDVEERGVAIHELE
jgi:hypothetical protein